MTITQVFNRLHEDTLIIELTLIFGITVILIMLINKK